MFFSISLYTALILCGTGLIYKVLSWFRYPINNQAQGITTAGRVSAAAKGVISSLFSIKIFSLIKILIPGRTSSGKAPEGKLSSVVNTLVHFRRLHFITADACLGPICDQKAFQ